MILRVAVGFLAAAAVLILGWLLEKPATTASFRVLDDGPTGLTGEFFLVNLGPAPMNGWTLSFDLDATISTLWGGKIESRQGRRYTVRPAEWNQRIGSQEAVTVGFRAVPGGQTPRRVFFFASEPPEQPAAAPTPPPKTTRPAWVAPTFRPRADAPATQSGQVKASFESGDSWGVAGQVQITLQNQTWRTLRGWTLFVEYPAHLSGAQGAVLTASAGTKHRLDSPGLGLNAWIPPRSSIRATVRTVPALASAAPRRATVLALGSPSFDAPFNYAEALQKSLYFYEAQRSGRLPSDNRVPWRGDSALQDGADVGLDLSGGYYDAGDHMKFAYPLSAALSLLSWGGIEYRPGFERAGQWKQLLATVRWGTDWLIKAHPAPEVFYGQVGDGEQDHAYWGPPEQMKMPRPAYKIDAAHPGSDLAGQAAAALASAAILFEKEDVTYSRLLLQHARELFVFADKYRGDYSESIPQARDFYPSGANYYGELVWAAAWLYRATHEPQYLAYAERVYRERIQGTLFASAHSWDDPRCGVAVLLAELTRKEVYRKDAETFLDYWSVGDGGQRIFWTPGGLAWFGEWGALRYAANTAFLDFVYADRVADYENIYYRFGRHEINYILGANPAGRSYMVGFGRNPPRNPHHRASHGSTSGSIDSPATNLHVLYGAMVGGPSRPDDFSFRDERRNLHTNEVALDYNAGLTGALARLVMLYGGTPLPDFPPRE